MINAPPSGLPQLRLPDLRCFAARSLAIWSCGGRKPACSTWCVRSANPSPGIGRRPPRWIGIGDRRHRRRGGGYGGHGISSTRDDSGKGEHSGNRVAKGCQHSHGAGSPHSEASDRHARLNRRSETSGHPTDGGPGRIWQGFGVFVPTTGHYHLRAR